MPRSHKVRLDDTVLSGIGKITHLCNPPEPVMRAPIYASRTVPEWDCMYLPFQLAVTQVSQQIMVSRHPYSGAVGY